MVAGGLNPLLHYALHGRAEGRRSGPPRAAGLRNRPVPAAPAVSGKSEIIVSAPAAPIIETVAKGPLLSVVMPTYNTPPRYLRWAIASVLRQRFPEWQLCIYDDGSSNPELSRL